MARLLSRAGLARALLGLAVLAIPFAGSGGCNNRTACLAYTQAEYAKNHNSCLSPDLALQTFTDPSCPGAVTSVDGPGTFDGELCCYPVTYGDITPACGAGGAGGASNSMAIVGETTGFNSTGFVASTGFTSVGPGGPTSSAFSSGSGFGPCVGTCDEAIKMGGMPCNTSSVPVYDQLRACIGCDGADAGLDCSMACNTLCSFHGPVDANCAACVMSTAPCTAIFNECQMQ